MLVNALINCTALALRGEWPLLRYILWKKRLNLDLQSASTDELGLPEDRAKGYEDTGGPSLDRVLRALKITPNDRALDIGSGKGGAILTLSKYPFAQVDGLDISGSLLDAAKENFRKAGLRKYTLYQADASRFEGYSDYNFFYIANPFPRSVMREVLQALQASLRNRPRTLRVLYRTPADDALLLEHGFRKIAEFPGRHGFHGPIYVYTVGPKA